MKYLVFLLLMIAFAACGGENDGESGDNGGLTATPLSAGRFAEVDITPPITDRLISLVTHDGDLVVFDEGLRTRFDSSDMGATWAQSRGAGYGTDRFLAVQHAGIFPDGRLLVYLQGEGMTAVSPDGTTEHIPIPEIDNGIADGDEFIVPMIKVLDDNRIMLTYSIDWIARIMREHDMDFHYFGEEEEDDEELYDEDGENGEEDGSTHRTTVRGVTGRFDGGGMTFGMGGNITAIFDITTGQVIETLSHLDMFTPLGANLESGAYIIQNHDLVRVCADGDFETLINGTAFAFGAMDGMPASVMAVADGFAVNMVNFENMMMVSRLFKYVWDADAYIDPAQTITIWSLEDNPFVRAAITEVWRNNPNANITYEIALGDTAISAADAIRTLNTRLLSGRGPDILILDGTPIESYAGRGMLLDLFERVDTSGVYQNIITPYIDNGRMYVLPTQFLIPVLMGTEDALNQAPTLSALVQGAVEGNPAPSDDSRMLGGIPEEERAKIGFNNLEELFDIMWQTNAAALISENRLDSDALREVLSAIEAISNKYDLANDDMMAGSAVIAVSGSGGRASIISGSATQFIMQNTNIAAFEVGNISLLQAILNRDGSEFALFPGLVDGVWTPSTVVGISADTTVADFAIEFVNTMLSPEVQRVNHGMGLPVSREALQWQIAQINEQLAEFDMPPFRLDLDALIAQLQTPTLLETTLREIIWETAERLGQGAVTLEGAVQEIEQNIQIYLAERS